MYKRPGNYFKYAFGYEIPANVLKISKYDFTYAGIDYRSEYSKYFEGLWKDMQWI